MTTALAATSWVLYRLWQTAGAPVLLMIAVAIWLALGADLAWTVASSLRPRLELGHQSDIAVGETLRVTVVEAHPPSAVALIADAGSKTSLGVRALAGASINPRSTKRGVRGVYVGELFVHGPLGLFLTRRRFAACANAPAFVGPVPDLGVEATPAASAEELGEGSVSVQGDALTKAIRPYRRGDSQRHVAWKASARSGELLVRDLEELVEDMATIVCEYPEDGEAASEAAIARAAGYLHFLIRSGRPVRLVTMADDLSAPPTIPPPRAIGRIRCSVDGDTEMVEELVHSDLEISRRLASAVACRDLADRVDGRVFVVSPYGDRWQGAVRVALP